MAVTKKQKPRRVTVRQRRFIEEYLIDFNGKNAAIRAEFSKKHAHTQASKLLGMPHIQAAIQDAQKDLRYRAEISQEKVLRELGRVAFINPKSLFNPDNSPKNIHDLTDDEAAAIESVKIIPQKNGLLRAHVKLSSKLAALEQIGRHLGMYTDKLKLEGELTASERLNQMLEVLVGSGFKHRG